MTGLQGRYRAHIVDLMEKVGYQRRGFVHAVRKAATQEEGFDLYPTPTAWREIHEPDAHGRTWTVFECVEPMTSAIAASKAYRYGETWFMLDAIDDLVNIRLSLMDEYGKLYAVNLQGVFYYCLKNGTPPDTIDLLRFSEDCRKACVEAVNRIGDIISGENKK